MSGHTKGPRYRPSITVSNECKIFDGDMLVATVVNDHGGDLTKEDCDRADFIVAALNSRHLIASAPALLALVERIEQIMSRYHRVSDREVGELLPDLRQVLAAVREGEK